MKIALLTRELDNVLGGMERQLLKIAQTLSELGHVVTIYSLDKNPPNLFYTDFPSKIRVVNISSSDPQLVSSLVEKVKRQLLVHKFLKNDKPDLALSFMFGAFLYSRMPTFFLGIPNILAERNSPDIYRITRVKRIRYFLFFTMYFSKKIVIQFERYKEKYPWFLRHKFTTIPNSIEEFHNQGHLEIQSASFIFAGRFSFQKQPLRLVKAFKLHLEKFPESKLLMYGSGELYSEIEATISSNQLERNVSVHAPIPDITKVFQKGNVLCIPSLWEGFPNILGEALSWGIPAIGFENCDGVYDLITDDFNGWLGKDDGGLEVLVDLLNRAANSIRQGKNLQKNCWISVARYNEENVSNSWKNLISGYTL
jgi:GalNAc-alpha-(1->4)-GalNAc-alpha-(1->3)-diNAcBac-PP-undecaprenol alpha-1,4-N-acetyl-D-galactosaminyltransferase